MATERPPPEVVEEACSEPPSELFFRGEDDTVVRDKERGKQALAQPEEKTTSQQSNLENVVATVAHNKS